MPFFRRLRRFCRSVRRRKLFLFERTPPRLTYITVDLKGFPRIAFRFFILQNKEFAVSKEIDIPIENPQAATQQRQIEIDDTKALALYANFCRVTGTPEELIIDFGLNPQPFGVPTQPIAISQRIITNFFTAKRMLHALHLTVQRHEQTFGLLETDVQKRVRPGFTG
jgi:hypothetical protein